MYRHAGIDIYLSSRFSGRGLGTEAVTLLAAFLMRERGHHRPGRGRGRGCGKKGKAPVVLAETHLIAREFAEL